MLPHDHAARGRSATSRQPNLLVKPVYVVVKSRTQYYPMAILAAAIFGPRGIVRSAGASVQSSLPQTTTVDFARNQATISLAVLGLNGATWSALIQGELPRESQQECVLADVDVARRLRRSGPSTVMTVTAAVPGATVNPVRFHPSTAYSALHQPGEHVIARRSVLTPPGRTTLLHRDEVGFTDQRGMRHGPRDRPLARDRRPPRAGPAAVSAPHLTSRVARVGQDHCHRPQVPRLPAAVPIPLRIGSGRARHALLVQLPRDPGDAAPREPLGEHPPHVRRRVRVRGQPTTAPSPRGVRPVRVRTRVHQPIPVRRATAEKPALLDRLRRHRRHRPMT